MADGDALAASLAALDPAAGRLFVAQRLRVELDERAAAHDDDDFYDPVADDLRRQAAWAAGEQPTEAGGFDAETYTTDVRLIRALHKATLPPREDVFDAAKRGDLPLLRRLVELLGHSVNALDPWDASPLYYACLCGHEIVVRYLLEHGAVCESNSWDGERCFYVCLTDSIRAELRQYAAANRARGPLFALTFRAHNNAACHADVRFCLPPGAGGGEELVLHAHRALLAARSPYMRAAFRAGGRWARRALVPLRDPRLSRIALSAVLAYCYTERLLCPRSALRDVAAVARNLRLTALADYVSCYAAELEAAAAAAGASSGGGGDGGGMFGMVALDLGAPYALGSVPEGWDAPDDDDGGAGAAGSGSASSGSSASSGGDAAGGAATKAALLARLVRAGLRRDVYRHVFMGRGLGPGGAAARPVVPPRAWDLQLSLALAARDDAAAADGSGGVAPPGGSGGAAAAASSLAQAGDDEEDGDDDGADAEGARASLHDVELRVHGLRFRCHALFLCGRSRYFDTLLRFEDAKAGRGQGAGGDAGGSGSATQPPPPSPPASDAAQRAGVRRIVCDAVSPLTMAICLEWLYCDTLRRVPLPLLLEALHAADVLLLGDGIKPLLVGQAIDALSLDTVVDLLAAADLYNLHRLAGACARFVAGHLDAVLGLHDFEALIVANAAGIVGRQAVDSVPMLDDIKTELQLLLAPPAAAAEAARQAAAGPGGTPDAAARRAELERRLRLLDAFAARLGLRCFGSDEARYRGVAHSGERGADAPAGSGSGVHGRAAEPLTSSLFRAIKGLAVA